MDEKKPALKRALAAWKAQPRWKQGACLGVAAVLIALIVALVLMNSGYRGAVRDIAGAIRSENARTLAELDLNQYGEDVDALESSYVYYIRDIRRPFDAAFDGEKYRIRYEIKDVEKVTGDALDEINEEVQAYFGDAVPKIQKIVRLSVTFTASANGATCSVTRSYELVKVKGQWRMNPTG